jgi:hypothetical protein
MAVTHLYVDPNTPYGSQLRQAVQVLNQGYKLLQSVRGTLTTMLDGGVAGEYMRAKFGCPDIATAQSVFNEIDALVLKLTSDASQTNVKTALEQAFNKFG